MKTIGIISIIVLVLLFISLLVVLCCSSSKPSYITKTKDGFKGVPISELNQPLAFYVKHKDTTLTYLKVVYPAAVEKLESFSALQLASLYNSLWFYFNCAGQYLDNDLGHLIDSEGKTVPAQWGPLPCAQQYPLPYTPQGWLYNFYTYNKYNVPEVNSDSDPKQIHLKVQNSSSNRAGIMGTYIDRWTRNSGIMWVNNRSIQRDVWHPNGLHNHKLLNSDDPDQWEIVVGQTPTFNFPDNWYGNLGDNQYIEVTHSPPFTGDALNMSPFWWYNVNVGSGMFLFLGKTLAVKNKISGIFYQARLLARTSAGRQLLMKWYNSIDPYEITWGIVGLCGYNSVTKQQYCDFSLQECGKACDPNVIGYLRAANLQDTISSFYVETMKLQKSLGIAGDTPTQEAIHKAIDLAIDNQHYGLAHVAEHVLADETNFFFGLNLGLDTIQFYEDPNGNDIYCFEIIDLRIPESAKAAAKNRDYSGFMNIKVPNAKPIDTPSGWIDPAVAHLNSYKEGAIKEYLQNAYDNDWVSIRDPFDVYNAKKVIKCNGLVLSKPCNGKYANTMYCDKLPLLNAYKCLALGNEFNNNTCELIGSNPTC